MTTRAKTEYEVLGLEDTASLDDVKRGYRRQMALYHPDKLQHLGHEFVDLALKRTTELTAAYTSLSRRLNGSTVPSRSADVARAIVTESGPREPPLDSGPTVEDAFLKSAALATFREAAATAVGDLATMRVQGFDAAFTSEGRSGFLRPAVPPLLLLVRMVPTVDGAAVEDAWRSAARVPGEPTRLRCAFVMGQSLAPVDDLARAVARQRDRPNRSSASILLIPVDLRSWRSFVPADAPDALRAIINAFRR